MCGVCSGKRITLIKFKLCAEIQVNRLAKRNSLNRSEMLTHWRAVFGVCVRVSCCPVHSSTSTSIANEKLLQFTFGCLNNNHPLVLTHALTSFTRAFIIHLGKDFPISFIWRFINAFSPLLYQKKCQHFNHTRYKFQILGPLLMSEHTFTETGTNTHIHTHLGRVNSNSIKSSSPIIIQLENFHSENSYLIHFILEQTAHSPHTCGSRLSLSPSTYHPQSFIYTYALCCSLWNIQNRKDPKKPT